MDALKPLNDMRRMARWLKHGPDRFLHPLRRRNARSMLRQRRPPRTVLVVCHGNICRSPYAAAALRRAFAGRLGGRVRVESAGFIGAGRPCPRVALAEALGRGVNLSVHRSTPLTAEALGRADLVVVMDARQARAVWERFGRRDAVVLGDLDPYGVRTRGIADPINGSRATFAACYGRIDRCVRALVGAIPAEASEGDGERPQRAGSSLVTVALPGPDVRGGGELRLPAARRLAHHFTVDLEEYFQVAALEACVPVTAWEEMESRVAHSTFGLLQELERHQARATFFVLGWIARRHGNLVRALAAAGHEIASHGWDHRRVTAQRPEEFRASIRRTKLLLEDLTGLPVVGFRAPNFSIVPGSEWSLDVLIEEGYRYDSSVFPIRRPGYGYPGARRRPHRIERPAGHLLEFPPATLRRAAITLPAGGGAYFRLLPYRLAAAALRQAERSGVPATFYIHPWELDPEQPRLQAPWAVRLRHYGGLGRVAGRLDRLLAEFRFTRISDTAAQHEPLDLVQYPAPETRSRNGAAATR